MSDDNAQAKELWLVKVPKYLASTWKDAAKSSEIGKLRIPKDRKGPISFVTDPKFLPKSPTFHSLKLPSEHKLTLLPLTQQNMALLSHTLSTPISTSSASNPVVSSNTNDSSSSDATISFQGDIKMKGELKPLGDMSYMSMKRDSFKRSVEPTRRVIMTDEVVATIKPRAATQLAYEADMKKKSQESKKLREDKEIVQQKIFAAFEKQQYYSVKDLLRITNQPEPYLKEVLKEICNYNPRSANDHKKNMWELKPEFRHYKLASGSQS